MSGHPFLRSLILACLALSFLMGYSPQRAAQAEPAPLALMATPTPSAALGLRLVEPVRPPSDPAIVLPVQQHGVNDATTWNSYPIYGGEMTSIAIDPVISQTVYVGTRDAGVFKTIDGGASWRPTRQGLTVLPIRSLAIDPQHRHVLYAGTDFYGVWKSTDGGESWFQASAGLDMSLIVSQIVVDLQNSQILYAGMAGGPGLAEGHVFKSTDGGVTWVQKDSGITISYQTYVNGIRALAIDPAHPLTLYAGTTYAGAFQSLDGGATWTAINDGVPLRDSGSTYYVSVQALTPDPHHANRPSATFGGGYLGPGGYYIRDGSHWQLVGTHGQCAGGFVKNYLYFHPADSETIYCAGSGFGKSTDGGVHWVSGSDSAQIAEIAFHPSTPDTIYAAAHAGGPTGVFKSIDQGETWLPMTQGITAVPFSSVAIDPQNSSYIYAGSPDGYLYRTTDGGATWHDEEPDPGYGNDITDIAVDPLDSQKIYLTASYIYTSTDQGATFGKVDAVSSATVIAVTPHASGPVYVGTNFGKGIYRSPDGGVSWVPTNEGLPVSGTADPRIPAILSLAVDPGSASRVWAGLGLGGDSSQPGIFRSDDGGDHWYGRGLARFMIEAIAIRPGNGNTLLAGANYYATDNYNIFKSTDGGLTWQLKATGIAPVRKIVFDPRDPCLVYAATEGYGVLRSLDCGDSWHDYNAGIFYPVMYSLAISNEDPPLLVTGSYASGLYWNHPPSRYVVVLPAVMKP